MFWRILSFLTSRSHVSISEVNEFLLIRGLFLIFIIEPYRAAFCRFLASVVCSASVYQNLSKINLQNYLSQKILTKTQLFQDRIAFRDDSPQPRPDPEEIGDSVHFTVGQLKSLLNQFALSAPSGQISAKGFIDTMSDLDALTVSRYLFELIYFFPIFDLLFIKTLLPKNLLDFFSY